MEIKNINIDETIEIIKDLCEIPSPSGFTKNAVKYLQNYFNKLNYKYTITNKNSLIIDLGGEGNPVVFAAHVDTLGAMVRSIKSNGRIRLTKIGGFTGNSIEAENCLVHTRNEKEYSGTVQLIHSSPHVYSDSSKMERKEENLEIILDEKVNNEKEVLSLGIKTGDFISFDPRTTITDKGFIKSRHLDDKASAGILAYLAKYIKDNNFILNRKVYLYFSTFEEVGHGGSSGIPNDAIELICVDMGAVGDDLKTDEYKVSICAKDSSGPYDYDITTKLINIAEEMNLNYAIDVYPNYGSDASASLRAGYDIKHALIGPGVASSHGYERTHKEGIENTLKLIIKYL